MKTTTLVLLAAGFLAGMALQSPAAATADPATPVARVLLVTGMDYPGHLWRQTAPALTEALRKDARLDVRTIEDPAFLDSASLGAYKVVVLHFQNWEQPGPGRSARENLQAFVNRGGGVVLVHFACGAWHGEWPEFEKVAGRVWAGSGPTVRQHDPFGVFQVEFTTPLHPIAEGLSAFETRDELYTCLTGTHPIQVVAEAKSKVDGKFYPMAFVSEYGKGRTFHCVLGHDAAAIQTSGVAELYRRGTTWAAGLSPVPAR